MSNIGRLAIEAGAKLDIFGDHEDYGYFFEVWPIAGDGTDSTALDRFVELLSAAALPIKTCCCPNCGATFLPWVPVDAASSDGKSQDDPT